MARKVTEISIHHDTTRDDLELCAAAGDHTTDPGSQKIAAKAKAEIYRREQKSWTDRFEAESRERVAAQQFQKDQSTRQIDAQEALMRKQLDVAKEQAAAAKSAAQAAEQSAQATKLIAGATIALAIVTAILVVVTVISLFSS